MKSVSMRKNKKNYDVFTWINILFSVLIAFGFAYLIGKDRYIEGYITYVRYTILYVVVFFICFGGNALYIFCLCKYIGKVKIHIFKIYNIVTFYYIVYLLIYLLISIFLGYMLDNVIVQVLLSVVTSAFIINNCFKYVKKHLEQKIIHRKLIGTIFIITTMLIEFV